MQATTMINSKNGKFNNNTGILIMLKTFFGNGAADGTGVKSNTIFKLEWFTR
jgi:hypothetical protein